MALTWRERFDAKVQTLDDRIHRLMSPSGLVDVIAAIINDVIEDIPDTAPNGTDLRPLKAQLHAKWD